MLGLFVGVLAMMTIEDAADVLYVSCLYVLQQIEAGVLPCLRVGDECGIPVEAVMDYKQRLKAESAKALDEMVALSEELGLYQVEE